MQDHADGDTSQAAAEVETDQGLERRGEWLTVPGSQYGGPLKEYVGLIWIADAPGLRFRVMAEGSDAARRLVDEHFGKGHVVSLWNEQDARRPR